MRALVAGVLMLGLAACGRSHRSDDEADGPRDASARDGGAADLGRAPDLGPGVDAFVCMADEPPDDARETDVGCTIPFTDADCDGVLEMDPICPVCPHATSDEVDGTPCDRPGFSCEYHGPGFCNFWGCDCQDDDADGVLEWACWWPLC